MTTALPGTKSSLNRKVLVSAWLAAACFALDGCARPAPIPIGAVPSRSGHGSVFLNSANAANPVPGLDRAFVAYGIWETGMPFVIWTDVADQEGSGVKGPNAWIYEGWVQARGGKRLEYECSTADGQTGTVTLDGVSYRLEDGTLFLVSMRGERLRVQQLKRAVFAAMTEPDDLEKELQRMAQEDAAVKAFFAGSAEGK